ncbi:hypothetical protein QQF64_002330 [Cirrhinus molitorella]|uniref:Uncharacterized protein n=1 Tax=Cirrhinus molitorella TaxID=172907 RepID=A0ABR3MPV2_9TELE
MLRNCTKDYFDCISPQWSAGGSINRYHQRLQHPGRERKRGREVSRREMLRSKHRAEARSFSQRVCCGRERAVSGLNEGGLNL